MQYDQTAKEILKRILVTLQEMFFTLSLDELKSILKSAGQVDPDTHDQAILQIGEIVARSMGVPCDPVKFQQPYDAVRMYPLSINPDAYDSDAEFELAFHLAVIWTYTVQKIFREYPFNKAIGLVRAIGIRVAAQQGDDNPVIKRFQMAQVCDWTNWFRCTEGCFDMESGALIDPERAALREFMATWGHA